MFIPAIFLLVFASPGFGLGGADIGLFNDTGLPGSGVWTAGLAHIKAMLASFGYTYEDVTPNDINTAPNLKGLYKVILFPGGWAASYNTEINQTGFANIRNFVNSGGGFIGICAGAYFACNFISWQGTQYDYPLKLFSGSGVGSLGDIIDYYASTGCPSSEIRQGGKMTSIQTTGFLPDVKTTLGILYYGGPAFVFSEPDNTWVKVVARYSLPGSAYDSKPAMIYFPYGAGKVFLTGPHPEVSFKSCQLSDDADNWEIIRQVLKKFAEARTSLTVPTDFLILD